MINRFNTYMLIIEAFLNAQCSMFSWWTFQDNSLINFKCQVAVKIVKAYLLSLIIICASLMKLLVCRFCLQFFWKIWPFGRNDKIILFSHYLFKCHVKYTYLSGTTSMTDLRIAIDLPKPAWTVSIRFME